MAESKLSVPILRTKLYRPPVTPDLVDRRRLQELMDAALHKPATLVSAPAGWGKSVLVSQWAESLDRPVAWLALDASDSDVGVFLAYVLAAVRERIPDACGPTQEVLSAPKPPPASVLARSLVNDLDSIETPFVLVLDDYYRITCPEVHELVGILLAHPPRCLHMVMVTRRDPPLPLASLRGKGQLTDVRTLDLGFDLPEVAAVLKLAGASASERALTHLDRVFEGWPAGLRLVILALRHQQDADDFLAGLGGDLPTVQEYLVGEVLADQPAGRRQWLLETSTLDRFCSRLCDAVCLPDDGAADIDGERFIEELQRGGLFSIALDVYGEWYRYHHLFQRFLYQHLVRERGPEEIARLHARASRWFGEEGLAEEAIGHALAAGDPVQAAGWVKKYGHELMLREQCTRLERWLGRLPPEVIDQDPMLLIFAGWTHQVRFRLPALAAALERIDARIEGTLPPAESAGLAGALQGLRSMYSYLTLDFPQALASSTRAVELTPPELVRLRTMAILVRGSSRFHLTGRYQEAASILLAAVDEMGAGEIHSEALLNGGLCAVSWLAARFPEMAVYASRLAQLAKEDGVSQHRAWGSLYQAISRYLTNQLGPIEDRLEGMASNPYAQHTVSFLDAASVLAFTYQEEGRAAEANAVVDRLTSHGTETGSATVIRAGGALRAEIALRRERLSEAVAWARVFEAGPLELQWGFYLPELTLARVLIAQNTAGSRQRAEALLASLEGFARSSHNAAVLIPTLARHAILLDLQGDEAAALDKLTEAVAEAEPGRGLRFFLDLGPPMAGLLERLGRSSEAGFIGELLAAFEDARHRAAPDAAEPRAAEARPEPPVDLLTGREQQVLEHLARRLSNKEIAAALGVSPATVNSHLKNLYQKLQVGKRRQAVAAAEALGLLARR